MENTVLVTGSNGMLGRQLIGRLLADTTFRIIATGKGPCRLPFAQGLRFSYYDLDITDGLALTKFILLQSPANIVHAAAMTQPDPCELDPIGCWHVNVTATRFLTEAAAAVGSYLVYISTDFVFDGEAGPYKETDRPCPVNYYGTSKLAAEKAVGASSLRSSILRTVLVYGAALAGTRPNLVSWVKESMEKGVPIKVVSDQWRTPTYVDDLARAVVLAVERQPSGIFHVSGKDGMSPYDMALRVAARMGVDATGISRVDASTFSQPAKRPRRTGFLLDKARRELGFDPLSFDEALQEILHPAV
jgi:dTDP-4-dehydrorhamnose reductase